MFGAKMAATADSSSGKGLSVSEVTAIEYNRWLVEESHKKAAEERKEKHNAERDYRKEMREKYQQFGSDHMSEYKDQMATAKSEVDNYHKQNLAKGSSVKAEVAALAKQRQEQQAQWQQHGSSLARELGSEQKRRIKSAVGATSTRKREQSQAARAELGELEKARTERRNQAVENRRQLRERIQGQTSDAVTQEAKNTFFEQRKAVGDDTRLAMKQWKDQRSREQEEHVGKALEARAAAKAAKAAAKASLDGVRAQRAQAAKEMRDRKAHVETSGSKFKSEIKHNNKVVHDMMKKEKFVNSSLAKEMKDKATNFAELTRSSPATGSPGE